MESTAAVEALLTLQEIDREIDERRRELEQLSAETASRELQIEELASKVEGKQAELDSAEEELRRLQRSTQAGRATLKRLEARGMEIQNMKQHLAVRTEADLARRNLRAAEEDALRAMQEVEEARSALEELQSGLSAIRSEHERRRREIETKLTALSEEISVRRDRKKSRQTRVDQRLLQLYETVRSGRSDRALVPLTPDGVCGYCFTSIPLQQQADVRSGRQLSVCEGCGVILYSPED
ncbi:MAG: zinc ribbon domain-containing protein [Gemmatimonadota bacterium]